MKDLTKYAKNDVDFEFLKTLSDMVSSQTEFTLLWGGYSFLVEPHGEEVVIWHCGDLVARYCCLEDMFLNYKRNGKSFIECVNDIDFDDN